MKKNELKILQILAEIQNPDKIIEDVAKQIVFIAKERATDRHDPSGRGMVNADVEKHVEYYMDHLRLAIAKHLE